MEITTGVAFLMSSLYGAGNANGQVNVAPIVPKTEAAIEASTSPIVDSKDVESYVRSVDEDAPILVDIARCESHFRQFDGKGDEKGDVIRGEVNNADVGVMQINETFNGELAKKMGFDIYTTEGNVAFARYLYNTQGTDPWSSSEKCWGKDQVAMK